jgi:hypothetical protein
MSRQSRVPRSEEDDFAPRVVQRRSVLKADPDLKSTVRAPRDQRSSTSRVPDADGSSNKTRTEVVPNRKSVSRKSDNSLSSSVESGKSKTFNVIEGIVRDVDWKRKPTVLTVAVREHGHFREIEVAVPSEIFCIAKMGDLIKANVREQKRGYYIMTEKPRITIPTDRQSVIDTIKRIYPFEYKRGEYKNNDAKLYVAQRIYNALEQEARHLEVYELEQFNSVVIHLTDLAQSGDVTPLLKLGLEGKQIQSFYQKWITQVSLRNLYCLGLTNEEINRARCFLSRLLIKLTDNPFTIPSIDLEKAREICELIGREVSDSDLTCGKILRILYHNVQKRGWSYTPYDEFNREHPEFKKTLQKHREELEAESSISGPDGQPYTVKGYGVKFEEVGLYLREQLNDLEDVVEYVSTLMLKTPDLPITAAFGGKATITATPEQQVAIEIAVKKPISVITGGPGRGKTTCLIILIEELKKRGRIPIIVSSYGSAVSNAAQRTKTKAYTIHRFIASLRGGRIPPFDHIIIDEASTMSMDVFAMLIEDLKGQRPIFWNKNGRKRYSEDFIFVSEDPDVNGFDELEQSISRKSSKKSEAKERDAMIEKFRKDYPITLTLVGDVDQLPPIAAGNPFESIIRSSFVPTTVLTKNLRCEGLTIEANALKIRDCALEHFEEGDDFEIYAEGDDFFEEYLNELKP